MKTKKEVLEAIEYAEKKYSVILNKKKEELDLDETCHLISAIAQLELFYWFIGKERPKYKGEE